MARLSWILLFAFIAVLAINVTAMEMDADMEMEDELSHQPLTRPMIDGVLSSHYKRRLITHQADIVKTEPRIAKLHRHHHEDEWNGEAEGEDRFAYEKKLKEELRSLTALIGQSKVILRALPDKERRMEKVKNKLEKLHNEYAKEDAVLKYQQQRQLMKKIAKQELALKERVDALKKTETKLKGNIVKHQRTLRDVGVREAEMKILDM